MLKFFDSNVFFGSPAVSGLADAPTPGNLLAEMDHCGVGRALAWHIAQQDAAPQTGNQLLTEAIQGQSRISGCWTILPNQAGEFPPFPDFLKSMRAAGVAALRAFPITHHFFLNSAAMADWLEPIVDCRVPLFLSVARGANWDILYNLLAEYPGLVCVICDHGPWGEDRRFRPLIERYPNVYIETSLYLLDGGIEAFVESYGAGRLLFGSGFPECYMGGMMLAIRHAEISDQAKEAIAGCNLEHLIGDIRWEGKV